MWVVCDETYEMWQGGFEDMDIPDDLKLNEQTVRQIKALPTHFFFPKHN